VTKVQMETE